MASYDFARIRAPVHLRPAADPDDLRAARRLREIATSLAAQGELDRADDLARRALALLEQAGDGSGFEAATLLGVLDSIRARRRAG
jgi:hypothetical protein